MYPEWHCTRNQLGEEHPNKVKILSPIESANIFLNFGTPEIFAVIYLKFKQRGQTLRIFCQSGANGITNSEEPDQKTLL